MLMRPNGISGNSGGMRTEPLIPKELRDAIPPAARTALLVAFEQLYRRIEEVQSTLG